MVETFKAKGGTLLLSTPAEKLIYKDGKVEGVVAKNAKGDTITVNAKNVILPPAATTSMWTWSRSSPAST